MILAPMWLVLVRHEVHPDLTAFLALSVTLAHLGILLILLTAWSVSFSFSPYGTRRPPAKALKQELKRLFTASLACGGLMFAVSIARGRYEQALPLASLTAVLLCLSSMCLLGAFLLAAALFPRFSRPCAAVMVGSGPRSRVLQRMVSETLQHVRIRGCVDDELLGSSQLGCPYLGRLEELSQILKAEPIQMVLVALPIRSKYAEIERVVQLCESVGVEVHYMSDLFTTSRARLQPHRHDPVHFAVLGSGPQSAKRHVKRAMDVVGATLLLLLATPVMLIAAIAIRLTSEGPVFFVQKRYGHHRKQFPMFKFRTMVPDAERRQAELEAQNEASGPVFKLRSDPRLTPIGGFLRRFSIDELPQLFNVLRGEMSLVGPRPLPLRDVSHFEEDWLLRRFSIKPGLTCIWQISGRSDTDFDNWIAQDLSYIDHWSLGLDVKILLLTIPSVLRGKGAM